MIHSKVRGYNNSSGILYNEMNGLRQYKSKDILFPRSTNVYPMYENTRNTEALLKSMNDGKSFFNKGGLSTIPEIPNKDLSDGGFKNQGNVSTQDDGKPKRIKVSKEAKRLSQGAISKLPITPERRTSNEIKTLNKFNSFLQKLTKKPMKPVNEDPDGRAPNEWYMVAS